MNEKMTKCVVLLSAVAGVAACRAANFCVAARGRPSEGCRAIVVGREPAPSVEYAAEEFRSYVEKMTGVALPIEAESSAVPRIEIGLSPGHESFGAFDDANDSFALKAESDVLRVSGGCRGVLYGVYELLERFGGCGWYACEADGRIFEEIPRTESFLVPGNLDVSEKPAFARRWNDWHFIMGNPRFAAIMRINGSWEKATSKNEFCGGDYPAFAPGFLWHNFAQLVPEKEYFASHPEYYSYHTNKQCRVPSSQGGQLCLTNPDVLRIVLGKLLAAIEKNKREGNDQYKVYGVSQDDWYGYCECTNCAAIDRREGGPSGSILNFINQLAEKVGEKHPDVLVETLAYTYGRHPPKHLKARDNVMICLCTDKCEFRHPLGVSKCAANVEFEGMLKRWKDVAKNILIWDYTANFGYYTMPWPNLDTLPANLRYFRENGVRQVFEEGIGRNPWGHLAALYAWLIAKLEWNPDQPVRPLVERFCRAYYGKAAPHVLDYICELQQQDWDSAQDPMYFWYDLPTKTNALTNAFLDRSAKLWWQATKAAKDEPKIIRDHVEAGFFGIACSRALRYLHTTWSRPVKARKVVLSDEEAAEFDRMQTLTRQFVKWAKEGYALGSSLKTAFYYGELRDFAKADWRRSGGKTLIEDWVVDYANWPRTPYIKRIRDKDALDGHAIEFRPNPNGKTMWIPAERIDYEKGATYRLRVRMKKDGATAFEWHDAGEWTISDDKERFDFVLGEAKTAVVDCYEIEKK